MPVKMTVCAARLHAQVFELSKDVESDNGPFMLMWKWLWLGDKVAGRQFVSLEGQDVLKHATYNQHYPALRTKQSQKSDSPFTLCAVFAKEEQDLDNRLPPSLVSLYMRTEQYEKVLLWSYVTQAFNKDDAGQVNPIKLLSMQKFRKNAKNKLRMNPKISSTASVILNTKCQRRIKINITRKEQHRGRGMIELILSYPYSQKKTIKATM